MSPFKLYVIRAFATDYHSGQNSRGYRLLSLTWKQMDKKGMLNDPTKADNNIELARHTKLYKELVKKYGHKI